MEPLDRVFPFVLAIVCILFGGVFGLIAIAWKNRVGDLKASNRELLKACKGLLQDRAIRFPSWNWMCIDCEQSGDDPLAIEHEGECPTVIAQAAIARAEELDQSTKGTTHE